METIPFKKKLFIFLNVWGCLIFPLGIYTLLAGPSKWIAAMAQRNTWSISLENSLQTLIIILLLLVTGYAALRFTSWFFRKGKDPVRFVPITLFGGLLAVVLYVFAFRPELFIAWSGKGKSADQEIVMGKNSDKIRFTLGSYPDKEQLKKLKAQGYEGVITLMSELVIPAEPKLIKEEKQNAEEVGLQLIHIPMLPWVSGNEQSIDRIRQLVREGQGHYYVHCYLGRDRVNIFKKIVSEAGANIESNHHSRIRRIEELPRFERGNYFIMPDSIYLTPYPTDDEFFGYILNGQIKVVVSLLSPKNPDDLPWIEKEKKLLEEYGIQFVNLPTSDSKDRHAVKELMDSLSQLERPLLIHGFRSDVPFYEFLKKKLSSIRGKITGGNS